MSKFKIFFALLIIIFGVVILCIGLKIVDKIKDDESKAYSSYNEILLK